MAGVPLGSEDRRGQVVTVRLSLREKALFEKLAGGMTIAAWLREAGLEKAQRETGYVDLVRRQATRRPNQPRGESNEKTDTSGSPELAGPLARVSSGQTRTRGNIKVPSSVALTAVRYTPSKLVIRGSSDLIVFTIRRNEGSKPVCHRRIEPDRCGGTLTHDYIVVDGSRVNNRSNLLPS
jgi:hypothetical protein